MIRPTHIVLPVSWHDATISGAYTIRSAEDYERDADDFLAWACDNIPFPFMDRLVKRLAEFPSDSADQVDYLHGLSRQA